MPNKNTFLAALIAMIGTINFGFVFEYSAPAIPQLMANHMGALRLDENSSSLFGALPLLGALIGSFFGGYLVDIYGRQSAIIFLSIPSSIGWVAIMYAQSVTSLYIGRILTGISVGIASIACSVYLSEIAPASKRGMFGAFLQVGVTAGATIGAAIGMLVSWNFLAVAGQVIATILAFSMMFMPETPRWLISNGYEELASDTLRWLRGPDANINYELEEIKLVKNTKNVGYSELFSPSIRKPFLISIALTIFQQATGINPVMFFCTYIFERAGFKDSDVVNLIAATSQLVSSIIGYFLAARFGRVVLLSCGSVVMSLSSFTFGLYFHLLDTASLNPSWLALVSVFTFFMAFNCVWGSIPYLVMSEVLPSRVRGKVGGICAGIGWTGGFLVSYGFLPIGEIISIQGVLWIFSGFNFLAAIFVYYFVPETKGKTLEEIEIFFDSNKSVSRATEV
ncbi:uncharacterized protein TRIADDRAFT_32044 [Trichoplax adhaerens]|uniref:Major facilitator superfamily (MFS) profile domain-containing protein n=1 Tax=Trichoplax adhaerens TaxID=10228 RepID=B3SA01_TRIAD|nr:hypothetical protein TRIADDRAFT_32044 [Trichoplax adhaerens]EDV20425.1 hypothetical protein TRIADDRAFT_32044 [Trichoplax adhaerens]|eukprot:XP_002117119.1 hypothetical protein TRIADDRAFT_32044 [Trichoplax adhaerens]